MKNKTIILVFLLTLAANWSSAQRTLPRGVRPHAANWTYSLVKSMSRAGFDMPSMAAAPAGSGVASRNALQLDSTKTFYAYNLNAPGDSTPLFRSIYQYPQADTKVEINYQYDNNGWLTLYRTTFVKDDQDRLTSIVAEAFDPLEQAYKPDSKIEVFPHGDSPVLVDSFFTYLWDSTITDWHIILSARNTFDDADLLLENVTSIDYFGDPLIFKEIYSYDDNGDNYLIEEFAILGLDEFPSSRTDQVFVDHRPIEVLYSVFDGGGFAQQDRNNYAYTLFGALRLNLSFEWDTSINNWRMTRRIEYGFDNEQRVASKATTILHVNLADERQLSTYAYVEDENLYCEMTFLWNDDVFDWLLDSKTFYYYDGATAVDPEPDEVQALLAWPNPTTGIVQFAFESDTDVQVFGTTGQLVQSRRMQPGQALDFSGLPAGIYAVKARDDNGFYNGRIVKQ